MYQISLAKITDLDGITDLLQANSPSQKGALTGEFPREKVAIMAASGSPVIVARRDAKVVGVLFTSPKENHTAPSVLAMLAVWPGEPDAYVYGPVCIAESERGRGLLPQLYAELLKHCANREAVLFIRNDNIGSLKAHERLNMHKVGSFILENDDYAILSNRKVSNK
ncbi:GNAT family N-acetyltransferase [Glaciimonas soli]|uniref:GNAT family N-acetyltransferase n=1 Tax=Glaciimonas soli TaxID=2590999 RepID=A0A843YTL5_9BURK|nr:GNAT family N-acetyltransferase [Glaciimonas soli]MQR00592.1 GNAT family N-acetyltransferase [Glaciimonas soli]